MLRKIFPLVCLTLLMLSGCRLSQCDTSAVKPIVLEAPARPAGQTDVIELRCDPIDTVRVAVIGLGNRGNGAVYRLSFLPTAKIVALCDIQPRYVERSQKTLANQGKPKADEYTDPEDWKTICERDDIDLIYVTTHWDLHAPIAVYAMEHGKHVVTEVPMALTIDECWQLVNTAEKTRRHCMMLENCNYDFFELATLNMAQQGKFGEIVHVEGAYIHDLRSSNFSDGGYWDNWRLRHNTEHTGNLYPTHGLGPIAHVLNIHRGDRMEVLTSLSTDQFGMTEYAKETFGPESEQAKKAYKRGDMNTTIVRTANGKTMMIQHDVTSPRPYSRHHLISGTKGFAQKYPVESLAFDPNAHSALSAEKKDSILKAYEHPVVKDIRAQAEKVGGHGGMDFIMDYRLIYCLNNGLPLDQDVYDAVEWSCLVPLTELSVENGGAPVALPDFTRGAWKKLNKVTYYMK